MRQRSAVVKGGRLYQTESEGDPIDVGTPAWYDWLEHHTAFTFVDRVGTMTVRKHGTNPGDLDWQASCMYEGKRFRVSLGSSSALTLSRLRIAAGRLAGNALALEHNGDLYSCDHFVEPKYLLGNITERHMIDLVASDQQRQFGLNKRDSLPRYCRDCEVRFACHGECPRNRFLETPGGEPGLNYLCAGYKAFFRHIDRPMRIMAELLRRNRAPAEVMLVLAAQEAQLQKAFAKAGRNEPCPCGSGRKFKQCHGREQR